MKKKSISSYRFVLGRDETQETFSMSPPCSPPENESPTSRQFRSGSMIFSISCKALGQTIPSLFSRIKVLLLIQLSDASWLLVESRRLRCGMRVERAVGGRERGTSYSNLRVWMQQRDLWWQARASFAFPLLYL